MKTSIAIFVCCILSQQMTAQNVGIGSSNPVRGKLVVEGVAGAGATTAIFGDVQTGISLQQNWPTIGFNQYRNVITPGSAGQRMANGYSALFTLSQDNGNMALEMHGAGTQGSSTLPTSNGYWVFTPLGRMAVGHGNPLSTIDAVRGTGYDGTAAFRGTIFNTHFNYANEENTYIRGGKYMADVYINDNSSLGNIYMGGGTNVVGINTSNTAGAGTLVVRQFADAAGIGLMNDLWGGYRWEINNEAYSESPPYSQCLVLRYSGRSNTIMGWFRPDNGTYSANSDARLKEQVQPMEFTMEKLMKLRPVSYRFKIPGGNGAINLGLIAQEVKEIFPEMIDVRQIKDEENGGIVDMHGMNYNMLSVVAIKGIQEQQQTINELKKEIELLKEALKQKSQ